MQLHFPSTTQKVHLREMKVDSKEKALKCEKEGVNNKMKE